MIIKGSSRGHDRRDIHRLADHLLSTENESAEVIEIAGTASTDLHAALIELRMVSLGTRCRKPVYHGSINLDRTEVADITRERWLEAVAELEGRLGLAGHQRCVVLHRKHGREHCHVVWNRVDPETMKVASDSHNYRIHEETSRELESRWNLRPVIGAHTKAADQPRPVAAATHDDWQASERTGLKVADVAGRIAAAWKGSANGREFAVALEKLDLCLASGRRGLVVVDAAGTPHSIPRRLGLKAAEVCGRLGDVDPNAVQTVEQVKATIKSRGRGLIMAGGKVFGIAGGASVGAPPVMTALEKYWREQGFLPEQRPDGLWIKVLDIWFRDLGYRIELHTAGGEPTDEQIAAMVAAGKSRGWKSIRFFGGSEAFQVRARLEALRQGYLLEDISLECEDGVGKVAPPPPPLKEEMPDFLLKALGIPDPNAPPPRRPPPRPKPARPAQPDTPPKAPASPPPTETPAERQMRDLGLDEAPADHGPAGN